MSKRKFEIILPKNEKSFSGFELPIKNSEIEKLVEELSKIYSEEEMKELIFFLYTMARLSFEIYQHQSRTSSNDIKFVA